MKFRVDFINKDGKHCTAFVDADGKHDAERKVEEEYVDVYDIISIRKQ